MSELWKDIPELKGFYQASSWGRIRRLKGYHCKKTRICTMINHPRGLFQVNLSVDGVGQKHYVHNLVASAFLGKRPKNQLAMHKNGIGIDNRVENIKYASRRFIGRLTHLTKLKRLILGITDKESMNFEVAMHFTSSVLLDDLNNELPSELDSKIVDDIAKTSSIEEILAMFLESLDCKTQIYCNALGRTHNGKSSDSFLILTTIAAYYLKQKGILKLDDGKFSFSEASNDH